MTNQCISLFSDFFLEMELFFVEPDRWVDFLIIFGFSSEMVESSTVEMLDHRVFLCFYSCKGSLKKNGETWGKFPTS